MTSTLSKASSHPSGQVIVCFKEQESIRASVESLFLSVRGRKDVVSGEAQVSQLMWHLVVAVLSLKGQLDSATIASLSPNGPFRLGDSVIHITHCPEWAMMHECFAESDRCLRPLILSNRSGAEQAEALANEVGMGHKIEVLDITQFLVANMLEWTTFDGTKRRHAFEGLIARYNVIVEACETDPSLKIEVA